MSDTRHIDAKYLVTWCQISRNLVPNIKYQEIWCQIFRNLAPNIEKFDVKY